jgi:hypothetical protein
MIYVLGDSFSSGSELADHLYPSWPGHKDPSTNHARYQAWCRRPDAIKESQYLDATHSDDVIFNLEKQLSWPGQLAEITRHPVINQSIAKSGPSYWPYKLARDLVEIKPDTVILQFSSIDREILFNEAGIQGIIPRFITAGLLSGPETDYFVNLKLLEGWESNFYRFLITVMISQAICRSHGVKNIHVFSTNNFVRSVLDPAGGIELLDQFPDISGAWEDTSIDWLQIDNIETYANNVRGELPGGHYNAETNRRFAEMVANKYILNTE